MALVTRGSKYNRLQLPSMIANEALFRLKAKLVLPMLSMRTFQSYFANKIGKTISIKRPTAAEIHSGADITNSNQPMIDRYIEMSVDKRFHYRLDNFDEEATLDIVAFGDRYLDPGMEELAYKYDELGADALLNGGQWMYPNPLAAGSIAGNDLTIEACHRIRAAAQERHFPRAMNYAIIDPEDSANMNMQILALDAGVARDVASSLRAAYVGNAAKWKLFDSINLPHMTCAEPTGNNVPKMAAAAPKGGAKLNTDGWATTAQKVLNAGQLISIVGVNEVQPRGQRKPTGRLQTFVVKKDVMASAGGAAEIEIEPEIITKTSTSTAGDGSTEIKMSAYRNVDEGPVNDAGIIVHGEEGKSYRQSCFFHGAALEYANVELVLPTGARELGGRVVSDAETGLQIMIAQDFQIKDMQSTRRADIFFGVGNVRPDLTIRHIGKKIN